MSKGKFEPGKRVLLINGSSGWAQKYNRTERVLESIAFHDYDGNNWYLSGIDDRQQGHRVVWVQRDMILLDPDESPEQSADAMRNLYSLPQKVTA